MSDEGRLTRRESFAALAGVATSLRAFSNDSAIKRIVAEAGKRGWAAKSIGFRVEGVARALLGTPYVAGTLDRDVVRERCIVEWDGLDCVTFVESSIALARAIRVGGDLEASFVKELERIRYRGGRVDGYASRLHYTTDWLLDNESRGTLKLMGTTTWSKEISFMSEHSDRYPVLKARPEFVAAIRAVEKSLSGRSLPFVPRRDVAEFESKLRDGDLVAFATEVRGLDCSHVGTIAIDGGRPLLLHASSAQAKVVVDAPLADYVAAGKATGVFVARAMEPK